MVLKIVQEMTFEQDIALSVIMYRLALNDSCLQDYSNILEV